MNKLKLMYDVVKTMKEKENLKGTFQAEGTKDRMKVFGCANEFARNTATGETRIKLNTEFDWQGQKMKHESSTEFNSKGFRGGMRPGMIRHMHGHPGAFAGQVFPEHGPFHAHFHHGMHCGGFKEGLSRIGLLLQVLNNIKLEEKEDQTVVLSLNGADFPEEFRQALQERMKARQEMCQQARRNFDPGMAAEAPAGKIPGLHGFLKELHDVENPEFAINMTVNKNFEIEKAVLQCSGKRKDESGRENDLAVKAEVNFTW